MQRAVRAALIGQAPVPELAFQNRWSSPAPSTLSHDAEPRAIDLGPLSEELPSGELQPAFSAYPVPLLRAVGQIGAAYLVAEGPDGLYLIDQHAAHERVLFEAMMAAHEDKGIESQVLLEPITIELQPQTAIALEENSSALLSLGFDIEPFGDSTYRLRAVPALLGTKDPERILRSAVEDFEEDESPLKEEHEARIAARVCKRAAIKSGQVLSLAEQQQLIRDLEGCSMPRTCPHGRPTMIHLSVDALERQFGRRG